MHIAHCFPKTLKQMSTQIVRVSVSVCSIGIGSHMSLSNGINELIKMSRTTQCYESGRSRHTQCRIQFCFYHLFKKKHNFRWDLFNVSGTLKKKELTLIKWVFVFKSTNRNVLWHKVKSMFLVLIKVRDSLTKTLVFE